ncbi:MAG: hypothetical protein NZ936_02590, partial [Alphaproteobacteria bacterium]|nr:hypothetical protein [Alphaproteobacteria bacterium]
MAGLVSATYSGRSLITAMPEEKEKPIVCIGGRAYSPVFSAAMKASWGISTLPNVRIRFFP